MKVRAMPDRMRILLTLVSVLAVFALSWAHGRMPLLASLMRIEICDGELIRTVHIDRHGNLHADPHDCGECPVCAASPVPVLPASSWLVVVLASPVAGPSGLHDPSVATGLSDVPQARGPPQPFSRIASA